MVRILRSLSTVLLLAAAASTVVGCSARPRSPRSDSGPVLLIGLDGIEWNVVLRLLHDNDLPNLARLMKDGVYGKLTVTQPSLSPIIWTTIATGVTDAKHGIHGFVQPQQAAEETPRLYTSRDRRTKAFWNILSDFGLRVHCVGWWLTFPAEDIDGAMVAQVNTITPAMRRSGRGIWKGKLLMGLDGQVTPRTLEPEVLSVVPVVEKNLHSLQDDIFGKLPADLGATARQFLGQSRWAIRADAIYHAVGLRLLERQRDFDLFAIYFGGSDVVGHRFWRYSYPELYLHPPSERSVERLGQVLLDYYIYLDSVVGDLIEAAPRDTTVVVISDHGMEAIHQDVPFRRGMLSGGHLNSPPAFFVASGPRVRHIPIIDAIEALEREDLPTLGSVLDITPTLLAMLGIPVGREMDGTVMAPIIAADLLARHPVRYVARHTNPAWLEKRKLRGSQDRDVIERLEQLRSLGYLE